MKLPLPIDTQNILIGEKQLLKVNNLGLLLNKYVFAWEDNWALEGKGKAKYLEKITAIKSYKTAGDSCIAAIKDRQQTTLQSLQSSNWHVESFNATTDSRLIIGLGGTSVIETGMTLHPLYGFPYLPGSGLKGLARAYAEIAEDPKPSGDELREIFGSDDKYPRHTANNRQGKVFFMDGLPTAFPKLELDIMNPHYGDYYRREKPPADYLNPDLVTFLAVAAGQKFSFVVYSKYNDLAEKARVWLIGGLTELGAGGKTNVGYGYFKDVQSITFPIDATLDSGLKTAGMMDSSTRLSVPHPKATPEKDNSLTARLKLIKNPQTFTDFLKSIKDDEAERLKSISFKGMESVINIGLIGVLESVEASAEVKETIAQKMLEICKEPDKKYAEKLEKYKKLQSIAGLNKG